MQEHCADREVREAALRCLEQAKKGREVVHTQAWIDLMNSEGFYRWLLRALEREIADDAAE